MKFRFFIAITALLLFSFGMPSKSIYEISFKNIDGVKVDMKQYLRKKILITLIPMDQKEATYLNQLSDFYSKYKNQITIIGIPSVEHGYKENKRSALKGFIGSDPQLRIMLTEPMFTKKSSGINQSELLGWLTNKENNKHFNMEIKGVGDKFFIDESGDLYAVLGPEATLTIPLVERIMAKPANSK